MLMRTMALAAVLLAIGAGQASAQDELACRITQTRDAHNYPVRMEVELLVARGEAVQIGDPCYVAENNQTIATGVVVEASGTSLDEAHFGPKARVSHGRR